MYDREIGGTQREIEAQSKRRNAYTQYALEKVRKATEEQHVPQAPSSLSGFVCATRVQPRQRRQAWFKPPKVPDDYVPYHHFAKGLGDTISPQLQKILTPQMRTVMLGEKPLPRTPQDSVLRLLRVEDRAKLMKLQDPARSPKPDPKQEIKLPESVLNAPTRVIYKGDPQKQRRFEAFLDEQRRKSKAGSGSAGIAGQPPDGLSQWAWEGEKLEFMSNAIMMKPVEGPLAEMFAPSGSSYSATEKVERVKVEKNASQLELDRAAKQKMYGRLTRTEHRWNPNALLCKRFNVPRPRPGAPDGLESDDNSVGAALTRALPLDMFAAPTQTGIAMGGSNNNNNNSNGNSNIAMGRDFRSILSAIDAQKAEHMKEAHVLGESETGITTTNTTNTAVVVVMDDVEGDGRTAEMKKMKEKEEAEEERPSIDLFKAIFEDSSDDDDSEGESDNKEKDTPNKNDDSKGEKGNMIVKNEEEIQNLKAIKTEIKSEKNESGEKEEKDSEEDEEVIFGPEAPPVQPQEEVSNRTVGVPKYASEGSSSFDGQIAPPCKKAKRSSGESSNSSDDESKKKSKHHKDHSRRHHHHHRHHNHSYSHSRSHRHHSKSGK